MYSSSKNPELAKLYFIRFSAEENRRKILEEHISQLKEHCAALDIICKDGENINIPDKIRDIWFYQLAAARYGRAAGI